MALFNNQKEQGMTKQVVATNPNQINMIGEGTVFDGTLVTKGDIRVSGRVIGTLKVDGKVIVSPQGAVDGELVAGFADIAGQVQGELQISERTILKSTARVEGNIRTGRLVMEEGAVFNGKCQMGGVKAEKGKSLAELNADGKPARLTGKPIRREVSV